LDGVDDYLDLVGFGFGFMHDAFGTRTVTAWLKPSTTGGVRNVYDEGGSGKGFVFRLNNGNLETAVRNGGAGTQITISTTFPSDGQWHHTGLVFNAGNIELYLDGILTATQNTGYSTIGNHDDPGAIGVSNSTDAFGTGHGNYYMGLIDDVRLFDTALDANQLLELYNSTSGGPPAQAFPSEINGKLQNPLLEALTDKIIVYPNPVTDRFSVVIETTQEGIYSFKLADLLGRTFDLSDHLVQKGKSKLSFDISRLNFSTGLYYLKVNSKEITKRFKILIE